MGGFVNLYLIFIFKKPQKKFLFDDYKHLTNVLFEEQEGLNRIVA